MEVVESAIKAPVVQNLTGSSVDNLVNNEALRVLNAIYYLRFLKNESDDIETFKLITGVKNVRFHPESNQSISAHPLLRELSNFFQEAACKIYIKPHIKILVLCSSWSEAHHLSQNFPADYHFHVDYPKYPKQVARQTKGYNSAIAEQFNPNPIIAGLSAELRQLIDGNKRHSRNFTYGDIEDIPSHLFNLILCFDGITHISHSRLKTLVDRVSKVGSKALVVATFHHCLEAIKMKTPLYLPYLGVTWTQRGGILRMFTETVGSYSSPPYEHYSSVCEEYWEHSRWFTIDPVREAHGYGLFELSLQHTTMNRPMRSLLDFIIFFDVYEYYKYGKKILYYVQANKFMMLRAYILQQFSSDASEFDEKKALSWIRANLGKIRMLGRDMAGAWLEGRVDDEIVFMGKVVEYAMFRLVTDKASIVGSKKEIYKEIARSLFQKWLNRSFVRPFARFSRWWTNLWVTNYDSALNEYKSFKVRNFAYEPIDYFLEPVKQIKSNSLAFNEMILRLIGGVARHPLDTMANYEEYVRKTQSQRIISQLYKTDFVSKVGEFLGVGSDWGYYGHRPGNSIKELLNTVNSLTITLWRESDYDDVASDAYPLDPRLLVTNIQPYKEKLSDQILVDVSCCNGRHDYFVCKCGSEVEFPLELCLSCGRKGVHDKQRVCSRVLSRLSKWGQLVKNGAYKRAIVKVNTPNVFEASAVLNDLGCDYEILRNNSFSERSFEVYVQLTKTPWYRSPKNKSESLSYVLRQPIAHEKLYFDWLDDKHRDDLLRLRADLSKQRRIATKLASMTPVQRLIRIAKKKYGKDNLFSQTPRVDYLELIFSTGQYGEIWKYGTNRSANEVTEHSYELEGQVEFHIDDPKNAFAFILFLAEPRPLAAEPEPEMDSGVDGADGKWGLDDDQGAYKCESIDGYSPEVDKSQIGREFKDFWEALAFVVDRVGSGDMLQRTIKLPTNVEAVTGIENLYTGSIPKTHRFIIGHDSNGVYILTAFRLHAPTYLDADIVPGWTRHCFPNDGFCAFHAKAFLSNSEITRVVDTWPIRPVVTKDNIAEIVTDIPIVFQKKEGEIELPKGKDIFLFVYNIPGGMHCAVYTKGAEQELTPTHSMFRNTAEIDLISCIPGASLRSIVESFTSYTYGDESKPGMIKEHKKAHLCFEKTLSMDEKTRLKTNFTIFQGGPGCCKTTTFLRWVVTMVDFHKGKLPGQLVYVAPSGIERDRVQGLLIKTLNIVADSVKDAEYLLYKKYNIVVKTFMMVFVAHPRTGYSPITPTDWVVVDEAFTHLTHFYIMLTYVFDGMVRRQPGLEMRPFRIVALGDRFQMDVNKKLYPGSKIDLGRGFSPADWLKLVPAKAIVTVNQTWRFGQRLANTLNTITPQNGLVSRLYKPLTIREESIKHLDAYLGMGEPVVVASRKKSGFNKPGIISIRQAQGNSFYRMVLIVHGKSVKHLFASKKQLYVALSRIESELILIGDAQSVDLFFHLLKTMYGAQIGGMIAPINDKLDNFVPDFILRSPTFYNPGRLEKATIDVMDGHDDFKDFLPNLPYPTAMHAGLSAPKKADLMVDVAMLTATEWEHVALSENPLGTINRVSDGIQELATVTQRLTVAAEVLKKVRAYKQHIQLPQCFMRSFVDEAKLKLTLIEFDELFSQSLNEFLIHVNMNAKDYEDLELEYRKGATEHNKTQIKPKGMESALKGKLSEDEPKTGQPVVAAKKKLNAFFSPLFRFITKVLQQCLKPNIIWAAGLSNAQMYERVAKFANWEGDFYEGDYTEMDASHSKARWRTVEQVIQLILPMISKLLKNFNQHATYISVVGSYLKYLLVEQLGSGFPHTFWYNTFVELIDYCEACLNSLGYNWADYLNFMMVGGDDNALQFSKAVRLNFDKVSFRLYAPMKIAIVSRHFRFFNWIYTSSGVYYDPLLLASKLVSKNLNVILGREDKMKEHYDAMRDLMFCYWYEFDVCVNALAEVFQSSPGYIEHLLRCLTTVLNWNEKFLRSAMHVSHASSFLIGGVIYSKNELEQNQSTMANNNFDPQSFDPQPMETDPFIDVFTDLSQIDDAPFTFEWYTSVFKHAPWDCCSCGALLNFRKQCSTCKHDPAGTYCKSVSFFHGLIIPKFGKKNKPLGKLVKSLRNEEKEVVKTLSKMKNAKKNKPKVRPAKQAKQVLKTVNYVQNGGSKKKGIKNLSRAQRVAASICLPGVYPPLRLESGFDEIETAVANTETIEPWRMNTVNNTAGTNDALPPSDNLMFLFNNVGRNLVYRDTRVGAGPSDMNYNVYGVDWDSAEGLNDTPSLQMKMQFGQNDTEHVPAPFSYSLPSTSSAAVWQPHGDLLLMFRSKSDPAYRWIWLDKGQDLDVTVNSISGTSTAGNFVVTMYGLSNERRQIIESESIAYNTAGGTAFHFIVAASGYYCFDFSQQGFTDTMLLNYSVAFFNYNATSIWAHRCVPNLRSNFSVAGLPRITATGVCVTNVSAPIYESGLFKGLRVNGDKHWPQYINDFDAAFRSKHCVSLEKGSQGMYGFWAPTGPDYAQWTDCYRTNSLGLMSDSYAPVESKDPFLMIGVRVPDFNARVFEFSLWTSVEYQTEDTWRVIAPPNLSQADFDKAITILKKTPNFTENPSHVWDYIQSIVSGIGNFVKGVGNTATKVVRVAEAAEPILSALAL